MIVLDPGHSPSVHGTDPETGLDTSEYENEPEMHDVFDVAVIAADALRHAGYQVILTKSSATQQMTLDKRADVADNAHADLAVSIHDQAGSSGGLPFASSNNHVYYQAVGDYRTTYGGKKVTFTNSALAATSQRYAGLFAPRRAAAEGHSVNTMSNTGYDLGTRGLQPGNMWIVQLLTHVPWLYNEAGGNSAGMAGLDDTDKHKYANGIVQGVEACIPPPR